MEEGRIMGLMESILFISGDAIPAKRLANFLEMDIQKVRKLLSDLADALNHERRGLQIIETNDCFQLVTCPEYGELLEKFFGINKKQNLSQAMMETLSIVAYRQPITRMDIELIRGVKCEYVIGILNDRSLIQEVGRMDAPGKPILYGTTDLFLKSFGLISLDELPPLEE